MLNCLWVAETYEDYLSVTVDPFEATDYEWKMMLLLNEAAMHWVSGKMDTSTYCDILNTAGYNPIDFILSAQNHIDKILRTT